MSRLGCLLALTAVPLAVPLPARAQEPKPDSLTVLAAITTPRSDLRNFVVAQEAYFADHATYARFLRETAEIYKPTRGVTVVLLTASDLGHSEIAIDERVPGLVCAVYVGNAHPPLGSGAEGDVVCRGP